MINYDIHWNPVRLMQRIGRVDRRMNPDIEARLIADHPEVASSRGKVSFWNFLPPDELNELLSLYTTVTRKTLLISRTLGIEGRQLLTPEDDFAALREFNTAYEGARSAIENLHLEYQRLLEENPGLEGRLLAFPCGVYSGRPRTAGKPRGVFLCYALPALDKELGAFTLEAGNTQWYFCDLDSGAILEDPGEIADAVRSTPDMPRDPALPEKTLLDARAKVQRHLKNTYLKRVDAPLDAPAPVLKCWMELH